jgi:structural maintenance of chromosome 2
VQLNVNNPHFLIMQGRIAKVLNMKPPEILSMLEKAAGTRTYQTKKDAALRTIAKKEQKCSEINAVLVQEITPRLERLREQSAVFLRWSAAAQKMQRVERVLLAMRYWNKSQLRDERPVRSAY